jgi:hypothetical protein
MFYAGMNLVEWNSSEPDMFPRSVNVKSFEFSVGDIVVFWPSIVDGQSSTSLKSDLKLIFHRESPAL